MAAVSEITINQMKHLLNVNKQESKLSMYAVIRTVGVWGIALNEGVVWIMGLGRFYNVQSKVVDYPVTSYS